MKSKLLKSICIVATTIITSSAILTGCGSGGTGKSSEGAGSEGEEKKEITITVNDNSKAANEYAINEDIVAKYKEVAPHVTIELETPKDGTEQENQLKIRKAANELPDVMIVQKRVMNDLKDSLLPLDGIEAAEKNLLKENGLVDGELLGICTGYNIDLTFYKKSVFEKLDLEIPTTWDEFIDLNKAIKDGAPDHIPMLMGAKDAWVTFPLYESFPYLEANSGTILAEMATKDEPFSQGEPFYDAVEKIQKLNDADIYGGDPVGMGFDQVKTMIGNKGAMIMSGQWFIGDAEKANNGDLSDIGAFLIPTRDSKEDPFKVLAHPSSNICINKDSENVEEVKKFVEWYFSEEWLPGMLEATSAFSPIEGQEVNLHEMLTNALEAQAEHVLITQDSGGSEEFRKIKNAIKFDVDSMGQEIIAGKDFKSIMADLNKSWKDAREKLGIK